VGLVLRGVHEVEYESRTTFKLCVQVTHKTKYIVEPGQFICINNITLDSFLLQFHECGIFHGSNVKSSLLFPSPEISVMETFYEATRVFQLGNH